MDLDGVLQTWRHYLVEVLAVPADEVEDEGVWRCRDEHARVGDVVAPERRVGCRDENIQRLPTECSDEKVKRTFDLRFEISENYIIRTPSGLEVALDDCVS